MKYFALIGAAGYIAPRHLKAIKDTGNRLIAAFDPNDSVGILDQYFPDAAFFTQESQFFQFLEEQKTAGISTDFISICSPNHLHTSHACAGMRLGADIICEKPLALTVGELNEIGQTEQETGKKVYTILQLRYHPNVCALKEMVENAPENAHFDIALNYITPRGQWYHASWKGDSQKSGGIMTNIGIHLFDMLIWIFGEPAAATVLENTGTRAKGRLTFKKADVEWLLSIDRADLEPYQTSSPVRNLVLNGAVWNFSDGFTDLHTESYQQILDAKGWEIATVQPSVALVERLRT